MAFPASEKKEKTAKMVSGKSAHIHGKINLLGISQ